MKRRTKTAGLLIALGTVHLAVLLAGFFAPNDCAQQNRDCPFAPPTTVHFVDANGRFHFDPFVCAIENGSDSGQYAENCNRRFPVHFFVRGVQYTAFGFVTSNLHLFGVDAPGKLFLLGTDAYGRDLFSRFLYGGQISLYAGSLATIFSLVIGTLLGTLAGYYGGWCDAAIMRGAELFLALPWLYLLFALRGFMPLSLGTKQTFLLIIATIGIVGWARPARLVRAVVLSSRERHYVLAARLFGGSDAYVIRRHILPDTRSVVLTQAALLVPQYVLAEVVLSFLGLGIGEPTPSWGNILAALQQYVVLVSYWWMLMPGLLLVPIFLGYFLLASDLQQRRVTKRA
jgi:peptide/nickel transport system permease protein